MTEITSTNGNSSNVENDLLGSDASLITTTTVKSLKKFAKIVGTGEFESESHFYPRVLNAQIHPLVSSFLTLGNERIIARYVHLYPQVDEDKLRTLLAYQPKYFAWAGCDLFNVTDSFGHRKMIVIETNSCPSGQKSMPLVLDNEEYGGYGVVLDHTFRGLLESSPRHLGGLAVVYDKNNMENTGYAAVMADLMKEQVHLVEFHFNDPDPPVKWVDGLMHVRLANGDWKPIRACFRYVTQKPWTRFPLFSKTIVLNSILSCLAGGRNKMTAARAYEFFNAEQETENSGLSIRVPETIRNVSKSEIPHLIESMGGHAVLKVPYSNAGQGVYTITNPEELREFMETEHHYDKFIVQSLVGNASWSSMGKSGKFYHVGTIPNRRNQIFVSDLRMMVSGSTQNDNGFKPVAIYARRARKPLVKYLSETTGTSWEMLGTNLSVKLETASDQPPQWTTEAQRLCLMDRKDFNSLGIGIDDLIDAYVQTVLSVIAIDRMCQKLMVEEETVVERVRKAGDESALLETEYPDYAGELSGYTKANRPSVQVIETFVQDGVEMVREQVTNRTLRFDMDLFRAINPDEALLQEIML